MIMERFVNALINTIEEIKGEDVEIGDIVDSFIFACTLFINELGEPAKNPLSYKRAINNLNTHFTSVLNSQDATVSIILTAIHKIRQLFPNLSKPIEDMTPELINQEISNLKHALTELAKTISSYASIYPKIKISDFILLFACIFTMLIQGELVILTIADNQQDNINNQLN